MKKTKVKLLATMLTELDYCVEADGVILVQFRTGEKKLSRAMTKGFARALHSALGNVLDGKTIPLRRPPGH